jgi:phage repressor protein C with HTH and peptisase S24 domain
MEPTLRRGDVAWAVPARRYAVEGLYVLDIRGTLDVVRAQAIGPDAIRISRDDPAHIPHVFTRAEFEEAVVGHVAAIGRIVAPTLLERRANS